ncbi:hypothetical protein [Gordonia shandongensis]|uniref:hypothetical protein n=1 Tax=Gordonia shandongensis TaxID=376351 RepID=UPI00041E852A|nr:hypothetical protein [Gordonia shandongensis]
MPNKLVVFLVSTIVVLITGVAIVLRKSRTEHPPVAAAPPRLDDLPGGESRLGDSAGDSSAS